MAVRADRRPGEAPRAATRWVWTRRVSVKQARTATRPRWTSRWRSRPDLPEGRARAHLVTADKNATKKRKTNKRQPSSSAARFHDIRAFSKRHTGRGARRAEGHDVVAGRMCVWFSGACAGRLRTNVFFGAPIEGRRVGRVPAHQKSQRYIDQRYPAKRRVSHIRPSGSENRKGQKRWKSPNYPRVADGTRFGVSRNGPMSENAPQMMTVVFCSFSFLRARFCRYGRLRMYYARAPRRVSGSPARAPPATTSAFKRVQGGAASASNPRRARPPARWTARTGNTARTSPTEHDPRTDGKNARRGAAQGESTAR